MGGTSRLSLTIGDLLLRSRLTLAVAESCTGGLLAACITDIPGSSVYFEGGVITYSNSAKQRLLDLPPAVLRLHGAVSEHTARLMAAGVRTLLNADVSLAVTGIAGPSGGTPQKPVGMVFVALAAHDVNLCREYLWAGDRRRNRECSVRAALEMLKDYILHHVD